MGSSSPPVSVSAYDATRAQEWSTFVRASRNGTFLLEREYMDYHSDRFVDASCMVSQGDQLVAVMPASRRENEIISHGGLTYGGLILSPDVGAALALQCMEAVVEHYRLTGAEALLVKPVPHIYHRLCAEDELYALFRLGFQLVRRDLSSTIDLRAQSPLRLTKGRKWGINRARKLGYVVAASTEFEAFMELEAAVLRERHNTTPVHSGAEMRLLATRFPDSVRLFTAKSGNRLDAGVIVYDCGATVHAQYIASNEYGRDACATDLIIHELVTQTYASRRYFDFGISTTAGGTVLNEGLAGFKESFGARATVYDHYRLQLHPRS